MAYTEKYVSALASGGGDGSSGDPWTFAESIAASAGDHVNVKDDGTHTISANWTPSNAGTDANNMVWEGYSSSIGDGGIATVQWSHNSTGRVFTLLANQQFIGLSVAASGANTYQRVFYSTADSANLIRCIISGASASINTIHLYQGMLLNCNVAGNVVLDSLDGGVLYSKVVSPGNGIQCDGGSAIVNNLVIRSGSTGGTGIDLTTANARLCHIDGNTVKGFTTGIDIGAIDAPIIVSNNLVANCGGYGFAWTGASQLYLPVFLRNAHYSCASGQQTGATDALGYGHVTLSADPFTNAAGGDYSLNNTSGGGADCRSVGAPYDLDLDEAADNYMDIGAFQVQPSAGGGGAAPLIGGGLVHV